MASISIISILLSFFPFITFFIFSVFSKLNIYGIPWNWPFLGMIPTIVINIHRIHDRLTEILQQSDSTFIFKGIWFSGLDFFLTVDPSNIHHVLSSNFQNYPKGPDFKYIFDILGDGIFNADSVLWQSQRTTAHALFRHDNFLQFVEKITMKKVKEGLIPILENFSENGSVLDLQDLFQRFSFDSTCLLVTGFDFGSLSLYLPEIPFSKAMDDVEEVIFLRHFFPKKLWEFQKRFQIGQAKRLKQACEIIDETIAKLLASKRESLKEGSVKGFDLITTYITNYKNDDKFLRDTVLSFMIAGRDTLSSALSWFFFCMSKNPSVEAKIREELKSTIPKEEDENQQRIFRIEELEKLMYFHGALCESLRLYPPVPFQHKVSIENDILPSGHHINPKTKILFSLYALGRMSDVWGEDCLEFKPERWISQNGRTKHVPSFKFLAFNAGPRTCLGKQVAFVEMKIVAAAVIHNYNIELIGHKIAPSASILLHMKHGFKIKISSQRSMGSSISLDTKDP